MNYLVPEAKALNFWYKETWKNNCFDTQSREQATMTCSACAIFTLSLSPLRIHFVGSAATQGIPYTTKTMKITVMKTKLAKRAQQVPQAKFTPVSLIRYRLLWIANALKRNLPQRLRQNNFCGFQTLHFSIEIKLSSTYFYQRFCERILDIYNPLLQSSI